MKVPQAIDRQETAGDAEGRESAEMGYVAGYFPGKTSQAMLLRIT